MFSLSSLFADKKTVLTFSVSIIGDLNFLDMRKAFDIVVTKKLGGPSCFHYLVSLLGVLSVKEFNFLFLIYYNLTHAFSSKKTTYIF